MRASRPIPENAQQILIDLTARAGLMNGFRVVKSGHCECSGRSSNSTVAAVGRRRCRSAKSVRQPRCRFCIAVTIFGGTLPKPAAWLHVTPNAGPSHAGSESPATVHLQHASSWGISPTNKKPFHSKWMTHNRPDTWPRLQSPPLWFALPASFAGTGSPSGDVDTGALAPERGDQEILALLCVSRR